MVLIQYLVFAVAASAAVPDLTALIGDANQHFEAGRYEQAVAKYEEALKLEPKHSDALYNAGMAAHLGGKPAKAAEFWQRLKVDRPEDFQLHAKLVQAYEAVGDSVKRDRTRAEIKVLHSKLDEKTRAERDSFCRDQFLAGGRRILVFEYFELSGQRPVRYSFIVLTSAGKEDYHLSLGSYEETTKIARELGEIGPKDRIFHLDGYYEGGRRHSTFGMYNVEPKYEDIKRSVIQILEGKKKPASSMTR